MAENYNGVLSIEIEKIISTKNTKTNTIEKSMILHTPVSDISIKLPVSIDTLRNYNTNTGDYVVATFLMWAGDFLKDVLPYRDILELTIRSYDTVTLKRESTRYRFILNSNAEDAYGSYNSSLSKDDLNKIGQFTIVGQCLHRETEVLRTKHVSGVFRSTTVKNVMMSEFIENSKKLAIEGKKLDIKLDVIDPHNTFEFNHIIVPEGTKLLDLPSFLQNTDYGVYNGSIGTYLQKYNDSYTIFIYPLFDKEQFEKVSKRLIIYRTDSTRLSYIENTFVVDGDLIKMIAGIDIKNNDDGGTALMDTGDALVASDPVMLTKRNIEVSDGKAVASSNNQLSGSKISERKDGGVNEVYVGNESNMYRRRSTINLKKATAYEITWRYADIDLIYPAMPVCVKYKDNRLGIVKLFGTVQGLASNYSFTHKTTSVLLYVMVTRPIDSEK